MAEHFCSEHGVPFKKHDKEGKVWYSHKIEGTDQWCNEPKETPPVEKPTPKVPSAVDKPFVRDNATNNSIEAQTAVKAIVELAVAGKLDMKSQPVTTAVNWAMSKLSLWADLFPEPPQSPRTATKSETSSKTPEKVVTSPEKITASPIDMDWLREQLTILQGEGLKAWTDKNVLSYLNAITKQKEDSIEKAVMNLSPQLAEDFVKKIRETVESS